MLRRWITLVEMQQLYETLRFVFDHRGYHDGQNDLTLHAYDGDEPVGHIDYAVWNDQPSVQMIHVPEDKRRRGYGTALVRRLQAEYPDVELDMGMLTDAGSQLLSNIPHQIIHDPDYQKKAARLEVIKTELARLQQLADTYYANPTEEGRQTLLDLGDRWNALYDEERELEDALENRKPSKRLFNID